MIYEDNDLEIPPKSAFGNKLFSYSIGSNFLGGFCQGDFCPGGFFVLIPVHNSCSSYPHREKSQKECSPTDPSLDDALYGNVKLYSVSIQHLHAKTTLKPHRGPVHRQYMYDRCTCCIDHTVCLTNWKSMVEITLLLKSHTNTNSAYFVGVLIRKQLSTYCFRNSVDADVLYI